MVLPTDVIAPVRIEVRHGHRLAVRRRRAGPARLRRLRFAPDGFYDFNAFNADLTGLFDRLGWDRAIVAGHDLGAMITIHGQPPPRPGGPPGDPGRLQARPG